MKKQYRYYIWFKHDGKHLTTFIKAHSMQEAISLLQRTYDCVLELVRIKRARVT